MLYLVPRPTCKRNGHDRGGLSRVVVPWRWRRFTQGIPPALLKRAPRSCGALRSLCLFFGSFASRVTADVFSPSLPVAHLFCSFSFLPSLAMLYYPPGRACSNFEPLDPFDCKEVAASLTFANVEGYADHVSRNRQTEFLGAGPKHLQFSDKLLLRYHRCAWGGR